jgi:hypothetical protein
MKQTLSITVKGKHKTWSFNFPGDPKYLAEWEADGLEVYEVMNTIPLWAQRLGLTHVWCMVQDAWRFLRIW